MVGRPWGDVFVLALTVRASGNRFTEVPGTVFYSYWSTGRTFSSTTENQGTHCIYTDGPSAFAQGNQVIDTQFCPEG